MLDIYLTAAETVGKPGMQKTVKGVLGWMNSHHDDYWPVPPKMRPPKGRGRCSKELHISCFPIATQTYFAGLESSEAVTTGPAASPAREDEKLTQAWENLNKGKQVHREAAFRKTLILQRVEDLTYQGSKVGLAIEAVAGEEGEKPRTVEGWRYAVKGYERSDWVALLMPKYSGGRPRIDQCEEAWNFYLAIRLRQEQPSHEYCYRLLERTAKEKGWQLTSKSTFRRRYEDLDKAAVAYLREGEEALHHMYPSQERTRAGVDVMHTVNCDGYRHNVFVRWPDGSIKRPMTWFVQDFYSGKLLAHRTSWSENTEIISSSLLDLLEYGVPKLMILDNTRSAANKQMTGGVENRYRDKLRPEEPLGKLPLLGIEVTFTSVYKFGGSGQSKPIERAFRSIGGLGEVIDKHPAFAGAWTGTSPTNKPENYNADNAIPLDKFLQIKSQEVAAWNEQPNRRSESCAGKLSFNEAFAEGLKTSKVKKASLEQRALVRMDFEAVKVQKNGTFTLNTGRLSPVDGQQGGRNRYHNALLVNEIGNKVIAWLDPRDLHEPVQVRDIDGNFICEAICLEKYGHNDKDAARIHNNNRSAWKKGIKQAAQALSDLTVEDAADMIPTIEEMVFDSPSVVEIMQTPHLGSKGGHEQTLTEEQQAEVAEKVAQINTEYAELARKSELVDRSNSHECVCLYGRLILQERNTLNGEQEEFMVWFEGKSDYLPLYDMMKDHMDFGARGLPKGRTTR